MDLLRLSCLRRGRSLGGLCSISMTSVIILTALLVSVHKAFRGDEGWGRSVFDKILIRFYVV